MKRTYLVDASASMGQYESQVRLLLETAVDDDIVVATSYMEDPPISVLSDGDDGELELDFSGGTPLSEALEVVLMLTDSIVIVITDGVPDDPERYKQIREHSKQTIREINLYEQASR